MTRSIGGVLDLAALERLAALAPDEHQEAVRRMAARGLGDHAIADATGLSIDLVCRILASDRSEVRHVP
jgi:hypothetical protein